MQKIKGNKANIPVTYEETKEILYEQGLIGDKYKLRKDQFEEDKRKMRLLTLQNILDGKTDDDQPGLLHLSEKDTKKRSDQRPKLLQISTKPANPEQDGRLTSKDQAETERQEDIKFESTNELLDDIKKKALKLKQREQANRAKIFASLEDKSEEDSKDERDEEESSEYAALTRHSRHSFHDSQIYVDPEHDPELGSKLVKLGPKIKAMILRYLAKAKYDLSRKHFDGSKLLITRRHRAIAFRRTLGNTEAFINYIVSFKIEREIDRDQLLIRHSRAGQNKYVHLKPILDISLFSRNSPLNCCSLTLDLDHYILNRTKEGMEAKLTKGNLELYCDLLLQELFVLDGEIKFRTNPRLIFNDPTELRGGVRLDEPAMIRHHEPSEDDRFIQRGFIKLPDGAWLNDINVDLQPIPKKKSKVPVSFYGLYCVVRFCKILLAKLQENTINSDFLEKYSKKKVLYHGVTSYTSTSSHEDSRVVRIRCVAKSENSLQSLSLRSTEVAESDTG